MHQVEIIAIVFQVAAHAILAIGILHSQLRVVAPIRRQAIGNFLVAFQAFECRRAGPELVAVVALGRAVEGFVRFGQWAGRNLCPRICGAKDNCGEN